MCNLIVHFFEFAQVVHYWSRYESKVFTLIHRGSVHDMYCNGTHTLTPSFSLSLSHSFSPFLLFPSFFPLLLLSLSFAPPYFTQKCTHTDGTIQTYHLQASRLPFST